MVFGDIGTSPLYAFKECIAHCVATGSDLSSSTYGILSLIIWSLIILVWIKYITFVLKADNHGEGGILALLNLALPQTNPNKNTKKIVYQLTIVGILGAALLYGDGVITPAISVLSAVEGLKIISPHFDPFVIPIAIIILIGLFSLQKYGTQSIGKLFGPIILCWFLAIGGLGAIQLLTNPQILLAFNPFLGTSFLWEHPEMAFVILGSVILVVTGGESLYADMGHFGREPIKKAWNLVVLPALLLNYLGQGALVLSNPSTHDNPFFKLAPSWAAIPFVLLAMMATIIASQALISGVFSLTTAAVQMTYLPRIQILHTNHEESGQIYVPIINNTLALGCILLVLGFKSSSNLAAAYGVGVILTMIATTILFFFVAKRRWKWKTWQILGICLPLLSIEIGFAGSNLLKILQGGWVPICIGIILFYMMITWKKGRSYIKTKAATGMDLPSFVESIALSGVLQPTFHPHRVHGTAVFLVTTQNTTPDPLIYNLTHNHVLHKQNIVLTISITKTPFLGSQKRLHIQPLPEGFMQITAHFGFMELPTISTILKALQKENIKLNPEQTTYFLGRETLLLTEKGLPKWQETLFVIMARNAQNAAQFFQLPHNRVIEIGKQVEI